MKHRRAFAAFDLAWALLNSASGIAVALFRLGASYAINLYSFQRLDEPLFGLNVATTAADGRVSRQLVPWNRAEAVDGGYNGGVAGVAEGFRDVTGSAHLDMGHAAYVGGAALSARAGRDSRSARVCAVRAALLLDHSLNHPCVIAFTAYVMASIGSRRPPQPGIAAVCGRSLRAARDAGRGGGEDEGGAGEQQRSLPSGPHSASPGVELVAVSTVLSSAEAAQRARCARFRWHLAYTLMHNRALASDRKRALNLEGRVPVLVARKSSIQTGV